MMDSEIVAAMVAVAGLAVGVAIGLVMLSRRQCRGPTPARNSLTARWPKELREGQLVFAEQLFRSNGPTAISARVDRAYRIASGEIVLVELKTRRVDRVYASDVIELSAQRVAIEGQTGQVAADHAYVAVRGSAGGPLNFRRVDLMSPVEVSKLVARRNAILAGGSAPTYASSRGICRSCAYANRCEAAAESVESARSR
jgi:hypothetical protein